MTGELSYNDAMRALTALTEIVPQLLLINSSINYMRRALEISVKEKLPIYDSLYIALAESRNSKLATGDKRQFEVAVKYVKAEYI